MGLSADTKITVRNHFGRLSVVFADNPGQSSSNLKALPISFAEELKDKNKSGYILVERML